MAFLASKNVSAERTTAPSAPSGKHQSSQAGATRPGCRRLGVSLDGVAKLKQAAAGNGPLCSVCWVQTGWALMSGVPARAFVSHGHHGRAVLQRDPRAVHYAGLNIFSPAFTRGQELCCEAFSLWQRPCHARDKELKVAVELSPELAQGVSHPVTVSEMRTQCQQPVLLSLRLWGR